MRDLNNDGFPEIATVNEDGSTVSILRNTSDALTTNFALEFSYPVGGSPLNPRSIAAGDFDDDGDADLAVIADSTTGTTNRVVVVLRNDQVGDGQINFSPTPGPYGGLNPLIVLSGDVNNDKVDDIVPVGSAQVQNRGSTAEDVVPILGVVCRADFTTQGAGPGDPGYGAPDGIVTASDLSFFVNGWVAEDAAIADITTQGAGVADAEYLVPDGLVTASDLGIYINFWVADCE